MQSYDLDGILFEVIITLRWCAKNNLEMCGVTPRSALRAYFLAAASIFEPSRAAERLAWARTAVLAEAFSRCLLCNDTYTEWLVRGFINSDGGGNQAMLVYLVSPWDSAGS